jgi:hypothetical protein
MADALRLLGIEETASRPIVLGAMLETSVRNDSKRLREAAVPDPVQRQRWRAKALRRPFCTQEWAEDLSVDNRFEQNRCLFDDVWRRAKAEIQSDPAAVARRRPPSHASRT